MLRQKAWPEVPLRPPARLEKVRRERGRDPSPGPTQSLAHPDQQADADVRAGLVNLRSR